MAWGPCSAHWNSPSLPQSIHRHCPEPQAAFCPSLPMPFFSPTFYTSTQQRLKLHPRDLRLLRACGRTTRAEPVLEHGSIPSREISQATSPQLLRDVGGWPPHHSERECYVWTVLGTGGLALSRRFRPLEMSPKEESYSAEKIPPPPQSCSENQQSPERCPWLCGLRKAQGKVI